MPMSKDFVARLVVYASVRTYVRCACGFVCECGFGVAVGMLVLWCGYENGCLCHYQTSTEH